MVGEACLRYQAGTKLEDRAWELSLLFGKSITPKTLRALYEGRDVNLRVPRKRLGGPTPAPAEEQKADIEHVKHKVATCIS